MPFLSSPTKSLQSEWLLSWSSPVSQTLINTHAQTVTSGRVTHAVTENCIVFATTGHARFEHARVLNNKTRVIPGITVRRYRSRSIPRQLNHCITGIIHTFTAIIPGMVGSSLVSKYQNLVLHAFYYSKHAHAQTAHGRYSELRSSCNV